ncbi:MAG: hypothetical protein HC819_25090, partial [Cyclobacteriaceae bacterium]|nr:hypothetical protein [Cyclobacteriaceae bacterium]
CGGPYYNLFVTADGQGIVKKTPNQNRYEGVQQVEITATPEPVGILLDGKAMLQEQQIH